MQLLEGKLKGCTINRSFRGEIKNNSNQNLESKRSKRTRTEFPFGADVVTLIEKDPLLTNKRSILRML